MKNMWEIKQQNDNKIQLYVYGDVEGDSYDWWTDEIIKSETSADHFREELSKYPNVSEIEIFINSYGGSVLEGTAIYNQLRRHPAQKTVHIDGFACSIASVIAMAGDKIIMPRNAMLMIHNAWTFAIGNATELRKAADDLDQINKGNRQAYLLKAGEKLTEEKLVEMIDAETWLTAEECIALGLADEYAEKEADMSNASSVLQKANLTLEQHLSIRKSIAAQLRDIDGVQIEPKEPTENQDEEPKQEKTFNFFNKIKGEK